MQNDAQQNHFPTAHAGRTYTNAVLTGIGVLLGVIALNMSGAGSARIADAQVGVVGQRTTVVPTDGLVSAAEQRKQIHAELRAMNEKVDRLQATLEKGLNVRVTSMPAGDAPETKPNTAPATPAEPANKQ
ncbi:MAG TPA: hypothetical protein VHN77_01635 [Phycisphaerales bacterium]|nr:hypothetical protein [Phycisphaerales bacterium]